MSKTNKFILWCVLVAIASFWMWVSVQSWFSGPLFQVDSSILGIVTVLFVVLLSLSALSLVLFQNRLFSVYTGIVIGVTYLLVFGISNIGLIGVFILVMLFYHAQDIVSGEMAERIKMNSRLLVRKGLMNFILSFFILISFAAFQSPAIESFKDITQLPSSTNIFIEKITEQTLSNQLKDINSEQKEFVLNQVTQEIIHEVNTILGPYFEYAPPALAFGLFLVLWGVSWLFLGLAMFLGVLIFWVLKKLHFFRMEEYDIKAEKIII